MHRTRERTQRRGDSRLRQRTVSGAAGGLRVQDSGAQAALYRDCGCSDRNLCTHHGARMRSEGLLEVVTD